jgi:hypothetical protein
MEPQTSHFDDFRMKRVLWKVQDSHVQGPRVDGSHLEEVRVVYTDSLRRGASSFLLRLWLGEYDGIVSCFGPARGVPVGIGGWRGYGGIY